MNRKWILMASAAMFFIGCQTPTETKSEETTVDSTEVVVEEIIEEESDEVIFDGEDKGAYLLYGYTDFDTTEVNSIDAMITEHEVTGEFHGAVGVTINEVCQQAGCWINFQTDALDDPIRVFFNNHFTIPKDSTAGKQAIIYGDLVSDTITAEFQKHLLEDAKEAGEEVSQAELDAITEDKVELNFECEAILVKK